MILKSYKTLLYGILVVLYSLLNTMVATAGLGELLCAAIRQNQIEEVKKLLRDGANVNAQDKNGGTPLHRAAVWGNKGIVGLLFEHGADVDAQDEDGFTPLHNAAWEGYAEIVKLLLEHGANSNAQGKDGFTPLHYAAIKGYKEIVGLLLEHGANINTQDRNGDTILHSIAKDGKKDLVMFLLECGANINAQNKRGNTPLHNAAKNGKKEVVKLLLECGADISVRDKFDNTPLLGAVKRLHKEIIELLLEYGADSNDNRDLEKLNYIINDKPCQYFEAIKLLLMRGAVIKPNVNYAGTLSLFEKKIVKGNSNYIEFEFFGSEYKKSPEDLLQGLLIAIGQGREEIVKILLRYLVSQKSLTYEMVMEARDTLTKVLKRKNLSQEQRERYQRIREVIQSSQFSLQGLADFLAGMRMPEELGLLILHFLTGTLDTMSGKLLYAAATNTVAMARQALEEGADGNARDVSGRTALHYFAHYGNLEGVMLLRKYKIKREIRDVFGDSAAAIARRRRQKPEFVYQVMSPQQLLFTGAYTGKIVPIKLALEEVVSINIQVSGRTALSIAIERGNLAAIKLLLDPGADVNAQDSNGRTVLHDLACIDIPEVVAQEIAALLISHGANSLQLDGNNLSPLRAPQAQPTQTVLSRVAGSFTGDSR